MAKRGVPAALHRELSEYASLLRALRVRDAMDITKQLTKPSPFVLQDNELNYDQDEVEDEGEDLPVAGPSHSNHPINAQPSTKSDKARGKEPADRPKLAPKQRRRDHWTRWPLPLNDVLVPEWTLEDEVAVIASQIMKSRPPLAFPVPPHGLDDTDDEDDTEDEEERDIPVRDIELDSDDPDPPYYVPYLTSTVANYLSTIFAVLASHTPARPASMQNRIEPLNWRAVIDVVVSCGNPEFANSKVVEKVIKRMEAIYGPSILPLEGQKATSFRAVERMRGKEASAKEFEKLFEDENEKYFTQVSLPPNQSPSPLPLLPKQKQSRRAKKEESGYRARTRWTPKDRANRKSKAKGKMSKTTEVAVASASAHESPPNPPAEEEQPVRRSKRAKTSVSYRDLLLPGDDAMRK